MNAYDFLLNIREQINTFLSTATGDQFANAAPEPVPEVFDVQPLGFAKLRAVEDFRLELSERAKTGDKLAERFVSTLPEYWFVQDMETYVQVDAEQEKLQEYNCSYARFMLAMMGGNNTKEVLWRSFWQAHRLEYDAANDRTIQAPLLDPKGNLVHAVANDSVTFGGKVLTQNPRVADMGGVVRRAYDYFVLTNKDAYLDPETTFPRTP